MSASNGEKIPLDRERSGVTCLQKVAIFHYGVRIKCEPINVVGLRFDRQTWQGCKTRVVGVHDKFLKSGMSNGSGKFRWQLTIINLQVDYGRFWVFLRDAIKWWVHRSLCRVDGIVVWVCGLVSPVMIYQNISQSSTNGTLTHIYTISSLSTSLSLAMMKRGGKPPK